MSLKFALSCYFLIAVLSSRDLLVVCRHLDEGNYFSNHIQPVGISNSDSEQKSTKTLQESVSWKDKEGGRREEIRRMKKSLEYESKGNFIDDLLGFYPSYENISQWMQNLSSSYAQFMALLSLGRTYENRDILLLKIGPRNANPGRKRPGFWLDAGIHAREWITISSAVYVVTQLLKAMAGNCTLSAMECEIITSFDWHVAPLLNPDGYSYSRSVDRLWRKNRSQASGRNCTGVDLNRNFDVDWVREYTSKNSCSEVYGGTHPGSENETISLMSYWLKNKNDLHAWLTLHSFGQLLMNRWSYGLKNDTKEYNDTLHVMKKAATAILNSTGSTYRAGSSPEVLYAFSGGSGDWLRQNAKVKHAYDMELRDTGEDNFVLPQSQILPTAREAMVVLLVIAEQALEDFKNATSGGGRGGGRGGGGVWGEAGWLDILGLFAPAAFLVCSF